MRMAGELDDRWSRFVGAGGKSGHRSASADCRLAERWGNLSSAGLRVTRLVTPGGVFVKPNESSVERERHGKCHRKQTAAKESFCDGRQGNLLIVWEKRFCW
jgi:hypothetical protein